MREGEDEIYIPEDWKLVKLGDLIEKIVGGGTPSKENEEYWKPEIPWATVKDLKGSIISNTEDYISHKGLKESAANLIPKNTLVIATRMALGKAVFFDMDVTINQDLKAIFPKPELSENFLFHWFIANSEIISAMGSGSTVKGIRLEVLKALNVSLPPLPEQQKIATILSTVDEKIEVIDAQITQTRELKKGLMQKLLTRGIGHTKYKDSVLGEIPESWEVESIGNHIEFLSGYPFKSEDFSEVQSGIKLLRGINITVGNLRWNDKIDRYWDQEFSEYEKYSVKEGDLVISMDGSLVGRNYGRVRKVDLPLLLVQRVACLRAKSSLELEFLNQIIGSDIFINYVDSVKTSSGIPHISAKDINGFKIAFPPFDEQQKIADILSISDKKIDILKSKKETYQQLKKGLMQQLLTGKVRVVGSLVQAV